MKRQDFKMTDYLVVQVSDHINEKYIGFKLIPARWVQKPVRRPTAEQNYLIRYPEEETTETELQIKNKEPFNPRWPTYSALIKFANGSYENACTVLDFMKEDDEMDLPTSVGEPPSIELNNAELSETPSTSFKRRLSNENEKITTNENILPKKKRVSAIRSENNTKFLIESGLLLSNKQKVSPKKSLSLPKEDLTETLKKLINAEKFNEINKLYSREVIEEPPETLEIISSTDDSDTNSENDDVPETSRPPEKSILETVRMSNPTITTKNLERSKTPSRQTVVTGARRVSSTKHLEQHKAPTTYTDGGQSSLNAEISNVAPKSSGNRSKNDSAEDIKHLEDVYKSILSTKSDLNALYVDKAEGLRKCFKSFHLVVPELKQGLTLPSIQQLRENRLV